MALRSPIALDMDPQGHLSIASGLKNGANQVHSMVSFFKEKTALAQLLHETLATSPMHGLDVFAYAPHSPGAADYRALTKELAGRGFI